MALVVLSGSANGVQACDCCQLAGCSISRNAAWPTRSVDPRQHLDPGSGYRRCRILIQIEQVTPVGCSAAFSRWRRVEGLSSIVLTHPVVRLTERDGWPSVPISTDSTSRACQGQVTRCGVRRRSLSEAEAQRPAGACAAMGFSRSVLASVSDTVLSSPAASPPGLIVGFLPQITPSTMAASS